MSYFLAPATSDLDYLLLEHPSSSRELSDTPPSPPSSSSSGWSGSDASVPSSPPSTPVKPVAAAGETQQTHTIHLCSSSNNTLAGLESYPAPKACLSANLAQTATQHLPHMLGPNGVLGSICNEQGYNLACYFWPAQTSSPKGVVVLVHGHGSHIGWDWLNIGHPGAPPSYKGSWVEALCRAGFSVAGLDLQGHGRSEGLRCYVENFDHYCRDVEMLALSVFAGQVPLDGFTGGQITFLMGASLGGGIVTHVMQKHYEQAAKAGLPPLLRGCVLLAPMLSLESVAASVVNRMLRTVAGLVDMVAPAAQLAAGGGNNSNPVVQQMFEECPLTSKCKKTRVRNALEYLRACTKLKNDLESGGCAFPFLVMHCEDDSWTECEGSKTLHRLSMSEDKTLRVLPGDTHALTKGDTNPKLLSEIIEWFNCRAQL